MIINFELSKSELDNIDSTTNSICDFDYLVHKLIQTSIDGIHFIRISDDFFEWIQKNVSLSGYYSEHLSMLMEDLTYQDKLLEDARVVFNITLEGELVQHSDLKNWSIGLNSLIESDYLSKTIVVVENIKYDGGIYDKVFRRMEDEVKKTHSNVSFTYTLYHGGGGGNSADLLEYLIKQQKIIVCICDSDQKVPELFTESITYNELKRRKKRFENSEIKRRSQPQKQVRSFVGDIFATPGHELENTFFLEMWEEIIANKNSFDEKREQFNKLTNINSDVNKKYLVYLYYDFKNGIRIENIVKLLEIEDYNNKNLEYYETTFYYRNKSVVKIELHENSKNQIVKVYESEDFSLFDSSDLTVKHVKVDKIKLDWFLDIFDLDFTKLYNFKLEFNYRNIIGDFLSIEDETLQDDILGQHMNTNYWQIHYQDWYTSLCWYFISGEFQSN